MKRQWGFSYILTKEGINRASADIGFMFIAYNLRRIINILSRKSLKEYLRILTALFFDISGIFRAKSSPFQTTIWILSDLTGIYRSSLNTGYGGM
jgi:hypothetical protein